jgi:hypothetical protein
MQDRERAAAGGSWQETNLVFCHEDGSMCSSDALNWRFGKMTRKAVIGLMVVGVPDRGAMSLWRTYSCWPGGISTAPGSGGNASVKVDPCSPVCTATLPLFACATPPTMASPSPAPGMPRAAGAR